MSNILFKILYSLWFILALITVGYGNTDSTVASSQFHYRYFPELENYRIEQLSKIDSRRVIALTSKGKLLEWKGNEWQLFHSQPPVLTGKQLFAFSEDNIWLFYLEKNSFVSNALHFDGKKWRPITLSQPYNLTTFSFLDSKTFWAGGLWGSLIYFDGHRSYNVRCPVSENVGKIKGLSEKTALCIVQVGFRGDKRHELYRIDRGKNPEFLLKANHLSFLKTSHPDSFLFLKNKRYIALYNRGNITILDTLQNSYPFNFANNHFDQNALNDDKRLFNFIKKQRSNRWGLLYLSENSFLTLDSDGKLKYYGNQDIGSGKSPYASKFKKELLLNNEISLHIGLSAYRNKEQKIELYFTSPELANRQIQVDSTMGSFIKNVVDQRNLKGYAHNQKSKRILWDGTMHFVDMDNDGDKDGILSALRGNTRLYENKGNDRFEDVTEDYNFKLTGRIQEISIGDLNNDGWLDIIAGEEIGPLHVLKNRGHWRFEDITEKIGFDTLRGYKSALADMNNDGFLDLFLFGNYDHVRYFQNSGKRSLPAFVERSERSPDLTSKSEFYTRSFGFADFDLDGDLDFILVNRKSPTKLFENRNGNEFIDVSSSKGFDQTFLGYGAAWGDYNMDGWQDVFVTTLGKNYIYWNHQGDFFTIDSTSIPDNRNEYSTACLAQDCNYDGVTDIVIANYMDGASHILYNTRKNRGQITVKVKDGMNSVGIGAHVELYKAGHSGDKEFLRGFQEIRHQNGYCTGVLPQAVFYAPQGGRYDLRVRLPSGKTVERRGLTIHHSYLIEAPINNVQRLKHQWTNLSSIFLNHDKRTKAASILLFILLLGFVSLLIRKYTIWQKHHLFFYITLLSVGFIALKLYFNFLAYWASAYMPLYIILITGILLFLMINHYLKLQYREDRQLELFDLIRQFTHSYSGMNAIDHLIFYTNNLAFPQFKNDFRQEVRYFQENTLPLLDKIAKLEQKLIHNRKIANRYSKRLSRLKKELNNNVLKRKPKQLEGGLKQLKHSIHALRDHIHNLFSANLLFCINQTLKHFPGFSKVTINNKTGISEIHVLIKQEHLLQVLGNLFQNALDAMHNQNDKRITITVHLAENNFVILHLHDFGIGIQENQPELLFNEHYTTKNSTGLGLYHAKKLLNRYGAKIKVPEKQPAHGALFEIQLKRINQNAT